MFLLCSHEVQAQRAEVEGATRTVDANVSLDQSSALVEMPTETRAEGKTGREGSARCAPLTTDDGCKSDVGSERNSQDTFP